MNTFRNVLKRNYCLTILFSFLILIILCITLFYHPYMTKNYKNTNDIIDISPIKNQALLQMMQQRSSLNFSTNNLANFKAMINKPLVKLKPSIDDELWIDHINAKELILASDTIPKWMKDSAIKFIQDGYVVIKNGLDPKLCKRAIKSFHNWCKQRGPKCGYQEDKHGHVPRLVNIHLEVKEIRDLIIKNKKALYLQDFLYGEKTSLYTSLFFSRGTEQAIHVDIPFFWTYPKNRYFGMWTALEDVDMNNGPLRVLERGHLCNVLKDRHKLPGIVKKKASNGGGISAVDVEAFGIYAQATIDNCKKMNITQYKDVYLQAGDTILWHPLLPHGGSKILDITRTRYSLVAHTVPEMVPVYKANVFFDPTLIVRTTAQWNYKVLKDDYDMPDYRLMADFRHASFGTSY